MIVLIYKQVSRRAYLNLVIATNLGRAGEPRSDSFLSHNDPKLHAVVDRFVLQ